jgi:non-specific serine/threonine protein kinase
MLLRRIKSEVLNLPEIIRHTKYVELIPNEREIYDTIKSLYKQGDTSFINLVLNASHFTLGLPKAKNSILQLHLNKLESDSYRGCKIEFFLNDIVPNLKGKTIVFSQYKEILTKLYSVLSEKAAFIYGDLSETERLDMLAKFKERSEISFLFITITLGGIGLDLSCAQNVVMFEKHWNPAVERQAIDRMHRIGQTEKMHVYIIYAMNTVDDRKSFISQQKVVLNQAICG